MQRAQRGRSSPSLARQRQRPATLVQAGDELVVLRNRQGPRVSRCAIMGHEKDLLSALQRSFERIFLLFCSFGNPLSDFVGVNGNACHPEPMRGVYPERSESAQGKLRAASGSPDAQILSAAKDDSQDTTHVLSREVFSPNVSNAPQKLVHPHLSC